MAESPVLSVPPVLSVHELHKTFRSGFWRREVEAVSGVSFEVRPGEVFGLLGPNGAGKTTTIRTLLGLVAADRGDVRFFGEPRLTRAARAQIGYLPENPYVYQYLRPDEFLDLCGRLCGLSARHRRARAEELLTRVGLSHALDRPIGKFSKGMMQRIGLAQALLHEPALLVLDEPMSGLDPVGRKQVRDLIVEQKSAGKTILFTSHILSDVERLCDRVGIMRAGRMQHYGRLGALLKRVSRRAEVELARVDPGLRAVLAQMGDMRDGPDGRVSCTLDAGQLAAALTRCLAAGADILAVAQDRESLETLFVRDALEKGQAPQTQSNSLARE